MIIVIGLGNPGAKYQHHRHNVGFQALDLLAEQEQVRFVHDKQFRAECSRVLPEYDSEDIARVGGHRQTAGAVLFLAKPDTFMNESGIAAAALHKRYPDAPISVVHDDIDIEIGTIKCTAARGAGGHNGVQSIIDHLGTNAFLRIRIGVRPTHESLLARIAPPHGFEQFLLADFAPFEHESRDAGIAKTLEILRDIATTGASAFDMQKIMNKYN